MADHCFRLPVRFPTLLRLLLLAAALLVLGVDFVPVRADIAPPEPPVGTGIWPGTEYTQVRMVAETVVMQVLKTASPGIPAQAMVQATFSMRNLGEAAEDLAVRFPLDYYIYGYDDGTPDIDDLKVRVNGVTAAVRNIQGAINGGDLLNWGVFDIRFPPGTDVEIEVSYTADASGYPPPAFVKSVVFRYVLATGAGWNGTIGAADIIVRLPYPLSYENVIADETGFGDLTPGAVIAGNEIRWRFEDFEPGWNDNIAVPLVQPAAWLAVIDARENVAGSPNDGELWGRLGKAIKDVLQAHHMYRTDEGAESLAQEAQAAYARAVELLPEDALWHYGYAELLFIRHESWNYLEPEWLDPQDVNLASEHLKISLELNPGYEPSHELLCAIQSLYPGSIAGCEAEGCHPGCVYDYLLLTATLTPVPPTELAPTLTPLAPTFTVVPPTLTPAATLAPTPTTQATAIQPSATAGEAQPARPTTAPTQAAAPVTPPTPARRVCPSAVGAPLALVGFAMLARKRK